MAHILRLSWGPRGLPGFPSVSLMPYLRCPILYLHLTSGCYRVSRICHFADSSSLLLIVEGIIAGRIVRADIRKKLLFIKIGREQKIMTEGCLNSPFQNSD